MLNPIPNFNILSYLVAVFDLNSNFSNFPIATGKKWCGSMHVFGLWCKHLYFRSSPIHGHAVSDMIHSYLHCLDAEVASSANGHLEGPAGTVLGLDLQ
jgi:hypothetical protein